MQKLKRHGSFAFDLFLSVVLVPFPDFHNQNQDVEGASFDEVSADKLSPWERRENGKTDPSRLLP